jgi:hypothetical protein
MVEKSHTRLEEEAKLCNKVNCKNKKSGEFCWGQHAERCAVAGSK